ncbi:MAG TPA: NADH-quinone oxidoreductase subunit C, partial [Epsilonproteobacteria bacterium]|nr:NADH-quinone oxidoreductase subunit C [Campylobacterota bacterium]
MRKYVPKDNVQAKSYYTDRFHVVPRVPRAEVSDAHFASVVSALGADVQESYVEIGQLVVHIDPTRNFDVIKTLKEESGYTQCSEQLAAEYLAKANEF